MTLSSLCDIRSMQMRAINFGGEFLSLECELDDREESNFMHAEEFMQPTLSLSMHA